MRRLTVLLLTAGCAQAAIPPGGPPDKAPPKLVRISPDTNAVNVRGRAVVLEFDEVVSERPRGASELSELFLVSPSAGPVSVSWHRARLEVMPRGGLRPNTTYTVTMLPGLTDLGGNVDSAGLSLTFSTGPILATGVVTGRVFDWVTGKPAPHAVVEAVVLPDSSRYMASADTTGRFAIRHIPPGTYLLRALIDQNKNRAIDPRELFDSATVTLADSLGREMLAAVRDSLGPGMQSVERRDSTMLRVSLDRPLDTLFVARPATFSLKAADSSLVEIAAVLTQADIDRMAADSARAKFVQDSVRRAFRDDSIRAADSARVTAAPPRPTGRRPGAPSGPPPAPARGTSNRIPPRPAARKPVTTLFLRLPSPLKPGTSYRLRADSLVGITGARRSSERVITTPKPAARPDTGARRDTSGLRRE